MTTIRAADAVVRHRDYRRGVGCATGAGMWVVPTLAEGLTPEDFAKIRDLRAA